MRIGEEKKVLLSSQMNVKKKDGDITQKDKVTVSSEDNIARLQKQMAELQKKIGGGSIEKVGELERDIKSLQAINPVETSVVSAIGGPLAGAAAEYYNNEVSS
jgi:hypothetical protein